MKKGKKSARNRVDILEETSDFGVFFALTLFVSFFGRRVTCLEKAFTLQVRVKSLFLC